MKIRQIQLATVALAVIMAACANDQPPADEGAPAEEAASSETMSMEPTVVASGLNGPQGVMVADDGSIWVIDSGTGGDDHLVMPDPNTGEVSEMPFGQTARIVRIAPDGTQSDVAMLPSMILGEDIIGGARLAEHDGVIYATSGAWSSEAEGDRLPDMAAVLRVDENGVTEVANTWDNESATNPAGALVESHPYDITFDANGTLWLTDAAGNTLYTVDPMAGTVELKAVFPNLPSPIPNPAHDNMMASEPVPTAVAFDAAGNTYVSFLPGIPFLPDSAKVVRVAADGSITDYATGLTMLTDLQVAPDGQMYAVSIGVFTDAGPTPNSGSILRIGQGTTSEAVLTGLSFPTSIAFAPNGDAYVTTNGLGEPGSGQVVKYAGFAGG